jgi:hypothetical protein
MKNLTPSKPEKNPAIAREFPARLTELEAELRLHSARKPAEQPLKAIDDVAEAMIEGQKVMRFLFSKKGYAAGHADLTYSGSNHARGVRHIRFYAAGKAVLDIEGNFEDQTFGSNFLFQNMDLYIPGEWEEDFLKLTDDLRQYSAKRKAAFKKKCDAERARLHRVR